MIASGLSGFARSVIDALDLAPHPEGGWYRRTWQSPMPAGAAPSSVAAPEMGEHAIGVRPLASLIYFLLPAGDASAWHVVDADEAWLWHGPGPVTVELGGSGAAPDEAHASGVTLGVGEDGVPCGQLVIPAGTWQRTVPAATDALVSCMVSPGFTYAGFMLADDVASVARDGGTGAPRP